MKGEETQDSSTGPQVRDARFLGWCSLGFVLIGVALVALKHATDDGFNQMAVYLVFFATVPLVTAWAIQRSGISAHAPAAVVTNCGWIERLGYILPPVVLIYGLWGINRTLYHADFEVIDPTGFGFSRQRFLAGLVVTALFLRFLAHPDRAAPHFGVLLSPRMVSCIRGAFLGLFTISLFNVDIGHDSLSYDPYTGPASAVALGAVPLVDVFSQYGLNFLLLTAGLKLLPLSMSSLSLIITILNLVYYLLAALICLRMARDKSLAVVSSTFLILFLVSAALYNSAYTPSVGAMRYLPSLLLVWTLCSLKEGTAFSGPSAFALSLSSLWSLEALIFSAVTYGAYLAAIELRSRPIDFRQAARRFMVVGGLLLLPYVLLSAAYQLRWGIPPVTIFICSW